MVIMEVMDLVRATVKAPWTMIQIFKNSDMATVFSTGLMERTTKVNGTSTKRKVRAHSGMLRVTYTKASSRMTWQMDMASIRTSTDQSIKESSRMMFRKAMVKKSGLTEPSTLAHT